MVADFMIVADSTTLTDFMLITPNTILVCDVYWSYVDKTFLDFHETRLLNTRKRTAKPVHTSRKAEARETREAKSIILKLGGYLYDDHPQY